ncbi:MAG TPA: ParB/RepB/Spo0J family partition protein [Candidatus Atribacteria bacterium]|nr:ParB/RepB/Spo0J family partition protein [Candidatus Atribacteria bacterium]
MSKRGLGKGLEALIPGAGAFGVRTIQEIDINSIRANPLQPRTQMDEEGLEELANSIRVHGVLQPLLVRKAEDGFELIAGERRWRAAQRAGLSTVPVLVEEAEGEKKLEMALVENLQREDLSPLDLARGIKKLMEDFHLTQEEVAERVGKKRSTIANLLRLFDLPPSIQGLLQEGKITLGHAKALLSIESQEEQNKLAEEIITNSLSVRETERRVKKTTSREEPSSAPSREEKNFQELLARYLSARVRVSKGKITIEYYGQEDLERLYSLIVGKEETF